MKKIGFLVLLAASIQAAWGQSIEAGTVSLGGSVGYSRTTTNTTNTSNNVNTIPISTTTYSFETTNTRFIFSPVVGYFIADNIAVGVNLGYQASKDVSTTSAPSPPREALPATITLQIGPYFQYYKLLSAQFGILGTLSAGYQKSNAYGYDNGGNGTTVLELKGSGIYASVTPAIVFFPIAKLGLSASIGSLGYSQFDYNFPTGLNIVTPAGHQSETSTFGATFGFSQLQFGGTYYFGRE
ncbi:hypothetical protein [Hymenobacter ruricola]|uniref:Outer membrane protein beta-barrel domain-containing protein n=1 Tax=Hymenobacter ruricola TaxID=2791023 RepID=A0ABS0I8Y7_9BACT|nr:hypothetical protein [Hymenobacter ruricola]MBF9223428.1 hypothetical protein [Hymenobacter ruricola]